MKRNDICYRTQDAHAGCFVPYGRISRRIDADHFEVIDSGRFVTILHRDEITLVDDYKGYWDDCGNRPRFVRMATLRKLKQMASYYHKTVWKRYRKRMKSS